MQYSTPANGTLYVKARLRKSPYANKVIALRLTANFYADFKHNDVLLMREVSPSCSMLQLQAVIAQMQRDAHAMHVSVDYAKNTLKHIS